MAIPIVAHVDECCMKLLSAANDTELIVTVRCFTRQLNDDELTHYARDLSVSSCYLNLVLVALWAWCAMWMLAQISELSTLDIGRVIRDQGIGAERAFVG